MGSAVLVALLNFEGAGKMSEQHDEETPQEPAEQRRPDAMLLFDEYLRVKGEGAKCVSFPKKYLADKEFHDLIAWDVEGDDLCGTYQEDVTGRANVCIDAKNHVPDHFGIVPPALEGPGLS